VALEARAVTVFAETVAETVVWSALLSIWKMLLKVPPAVAVPLFLVVAERVAEEPEIGAAGLVAASTEMVRSGEAQAAGAVPATAVVYAEAPPAFEAETV
jgi:hypothetical protein